jgi:hypothetical protein
LKSDWIIVKVGDLSYRQDLSRKDLNLLKKSLDDENASINMISMLGYFAMRFADSSLEPSSLITASAKIAKSKWRGESVIDFVLDNTSAVIHECLVNESLMPGSVYMNTVYISSLFVEELRYFEETYDAKLSRGDSDDLLNIILNESKVRLLTSMQTGYPHYQFKTDIRKEFGAYHDAQMEPKPKSETLEDVIDRIVSLSAEMEMDNTSKSRLHSLMSATPPKLDEDGSYYYKACDMCHASSIDK